jgi:hypothetical protein
MATGELLSEVFQVLRDNKIAVDAKAAAEKAAEEKAKVDAEAKALDVRLAADRLAIATKAAALAKGEHDAKVREQEEWRLRVDAEMKAIVQDRARRGKRALGAGELRQRAVRALNQADMQKEGRK